MLATEAVLLGDVQLSDSGYLEAAAHTARTGVQQYLGAEMGRPELGFVNVYRDAADVFSHASLHSFAKVPVTVDHPPGGVTAANWKAVAVGTTGEEVLRDGERLKIGLKIMDASAIEAVRAGKRELSVGYRTEIVWGDGIAPDGTPFQARQTRIVADHVAIVSRGRAGPQIRIGDSWSDFADGGKRDPDQSQPRPTADRDTPSMHKLTIDGITVDLSDTAREVVSKALSEKATLLSDNLKLIADHAAALKAKDSEIADAKKQSDTKDGEIIALKQQLADAEMTPAKKHAALAELRQVCADAEKIAGKGKITFDGKTEAEIRREAVAVHLGDAAKTLSDENIIGAFLSYASKAPTTDALGRAISDSLPNPPANQPGGHNVVQLGDAATEYARMQERDRNAWKMGA